MSDFLQKHCLSADIVTANEVAAIFNHREVGAQPVSVGYLCLSHERLRHELDGAERLLDLGAAKIARLEAEIERLRAQIEEAECKLSISEMFREEYREALQLLDGYDGDSDLWSEMKRQRDAAIKDADNLKTQLAPIATKDIDNA